MASEIQKLAHTLDVEPGRLAMISTVPEADLHTLREQIAEALFQADKHHFSRLAALSRAVPPAVAAKLIEATLPPLLAARTAELIDPHRAVDMVNGISDGYLADVSARVDASRAPEVIAAIPAGRVAKVAAELARRGEWVVIGGLVAEVGLEALAASVREYTGEQLLRIAFFVTDPERLDDIGAVLTEAQLDAILAAASEHALWAELGTLVAGLGPARLARTAAHYASAPEPVQAAFRAAVQAGTLDPDTMTRLGGP